MARVCRRICATHHLQIRWELEPDSRGSKRLMLMKLSAHLQQLSQHIGDIVPQPAHTSQSVVVSVERAMGASHGTNGWAYQAASEEADLVKY